MRLIPYSKQHIQKDDIKSVQEVLSSDFITQGPKIPAFETALAKYVGAKYAVVLNSGTSALHAAYFACGLQEKDEFITSSLTFAATANAGVYLGAKPVFIDVEKETGNIDVSKIEQKVSRKTRLVVPIHYSGYPARLREIYKLAKKHKLIVIEDACQALGAEYNSKKIGNCEFSDMTVFSFHPVKSITTGEGGAVVTNDKNYYEKILMFRNHGMTKEKKHLKKKNGGEWYYEMQVLGYNYRLTDIQASLGLSQLKKIDKFIRRRREIAKIYNKAFKNQPYFETLREGIEIRSAYHLYPIRLKKHLLNKRKAIFAALRKKGVGIQVHHIPTYLHPYYQKLGYKKSLCPIAEDFYNREISIPIYPAMSDGDVNYVIKTIFSVFKNV